MDFLGNTERGEMKSVIEYDVRVSLLLRGVSLEVGCWSFCSVLRDLVLLSLQFPGMGT